MSDWRRRAIEAFPDLRPDFEEPDCTIYTVFMELVPKCRRALGENDTETLKRVHSFAAWCARQRSKDLWNAAGVALYEHLTWAQAVDSMSTWVPRDVFEKVVGLLESKVGTACIERIRREYDRESRA
ncbi:MAG: hypothetical protein HYR85_15765 [Planctomycetes bacterium]|nr:hypothetical protein [Planctomycetota bacterium]MBI3848112.1 hypothetical protein [Planctomycetota bacterium]